MFGENARASTVVLVCDLSGMSKLQRSGAERNRASQMKMKGYFTMLVIC